MNAFLMVIPIFVMMFKKRKIFDQFVGFLSRRLQTKCIQSDITQQSSDLMMIYCQMYETLFEDWLISCN